MTVRRAAVHAALLAVALAATAAPVLGAAPDAVIDLPAGLTVKVLRTSADPGTAAISGCEAGSAVRIEAYALIPVAGSLDTRLPILLTSTPVPAGGVVSMPLSDISDWLQETGPPSTTSVVIEARCEPDGAVATSTIRPGETLGEEPPAPKPPDTSIASSAPSLPVVPLLLVGGITAAALLHRRRRATPV